MIKIAEDKDFDYIRAVMFDDEMWARCSDDFTPKIDETLTSMHGLWLVCIVDGDRFGLASVHSSYNSAVGVHIYIPKCNRGKSSINVGKEVLNWIVENSGDSICKINTQIPEIYKDVVGFASRLGFNREGVDSKSVIKNGLALDKICMGISFSEVAK